MQRRLLLLLAGGFSNVAIADGIPKIQFDQTIYDFGKISEGESIRGSFKFKNAGDSVLKVEHPSTSCGCTIAALKTDTLPPGETAEVAFTLTLRGLKGALRKTIRLPSNDPQNPASVLTIKGEYTPRYGSHRSRSGRMCPGAERKVTFQPR